MIEIPASEIRKLDAAMKKKLDSLSVRQRRKILRDSSVPMVEAARQNVKDAPQAVYRYSTAKVFGGGPRAPKGSGTVIATYHPGNLEKSIRMLTFRKSPDIFIGPKAHKQNSRGEFGLDESRVDPYYAHMVHNGTVDTAPNPFMKRAFDSTAAIVMSSIISKLKMVMEK